MDTSFAGSGVRLRLVSTCSGVDGIIYEYEAPIFGSDRKYHLKKVVSPQGEHLFYGIR